MLINFARKVSRKHPMHAALPFPPNLNGCKCARVFPAKKLVPRGKVSDLPRGSETGGAEKAFSFPAKRKKGKEGRTGENLSRKIGLRKTGSPFGESRRHGFPRHRLDLRERPHGPSCLPFPAPPGVIAEESDRIGSRRRPGGNPGLLDVRRNSRHRWLTNGHALAVRETLRDSLRKQSED